jgi:hypothetical protein
MKKYIATFYFAPSIDDDIEWVELIETNDLKEAIEKAKIILKLNDKFKSYGVEEANKNENTTYHCATNDGDVYLALPEAIEWYKKQIKYQEPNIRVWLISEDEEDTEEDLILFKGHLPY